MQFFVGVHTKLVIVLIVLEVLQQKESDMIVHVTKERSMNNENSRTKDSRWKD